MPLRYLLLPLALLAAACNPLDPLQGGGGERIFVTIELDPAMQFTMKGAGAGAFVARYRNAGETPVELLRLTAEGATEPVGTIQPDQILRERYAPGATALVVNRSRSTASVRAEVYGDTRIAMRYAPADE